MSSDFKNRILGRSAFLYGFDIPALAPCGERLHVQCQPSTYISVVIAFVRATAATAISLSSVTPTTAQGTGVYLAVLVQRTSNQHYGHRICGEDGIARPSTATARHHAVTVWLSLNYDWRGLLPLR